MSIIRFTDAFFFFSLLLIPYTLTAGQITTNSMNKDDKTPGLIHGQLQKCPDSPNCINTEYPDDSTHYLPPVVISDSMQDNVIITVKQVIKTMGGVITQESTIDGNPYLAATFTSSIFRFVDDFEVRIEPSSGRVHIRSASRTGYSDFGVNKRRVRDFIEQLKEREIK